MHCGHYHGVLHNWQAAFECHTSDRLLLASDADTDHGNVRNYMYLLGCVWSISMFAYKLYMRDHSVSSKAKGSIYVLKTVTS